MASFNPGIGVPRPIPTPIQFVQQPPVQQPVVLQPQFVAAPPPLQTIFNGNPTAQQLIAFPTATQSTLFQGFQGNLPQAAPVTMPSFSGSDIQTILQQLTANLSGIGSSTNAVASSYLANTGSFNISPLEDGVQVHKEDDSDYFSALGYDDGGDADV